MADFRRLVDIDVAEIDRGISVFGQTKGRALRILKDTIDDIADVIEKEAIARAPIGEDPLAYATKPREGPTLKDHPVERRNSKELRGSTPTGRTVAESVLRIPRIPKYAIFIHEGTGPRFARSAKGMRYRTIHAVSEKNPMGWVRARVVGPILPPKQVPYLREAYESVVTSGYVAAKVAELRARLKT